MGKAEHPLISEVIPMEGKRLRLKLSTGSELLLNMANRVDTVRFHPLRDEAVFNSVTTDGFYLHFDVEPNYALDFTLREALRMSVTAPGQELSEREEKREYQTDQDPDREEAKAEANGKNRAFAI